MEAGNTPVEIKGVKDGLLVILDGSYAMTELIEALEQKLFDAKGFFQQGKVKVQVKNKSLDMEELNRLTGLFAVHDGLELTEVMAEDGEVLVKFPSKIEQSKDKEKRQDYRVENSLMIKRTIRSGQQIEFPGTVVVIGNVNPGAEIIAGGDIIVFGELKGICHAGAKGNHEASISALKLMAGQLRIASIVSRAPENEQLEPDQPEMAFIQEEQIVVETLFSKDLTDHY